MSEQHEPKKIIVTWDQYLDLLRLLMRKIDASGFRPQQIVGISRGGLFPGEIASRFFDAPLAVLSVASYPDHTTKQEEMMFSRDLTSAKPLRHQAVLVIDDLTETGKTLEKSLQWICWWYGINREEVRTATLWHKTWSEFEPHYYASTIRPDPLTGEKPWIVQPQEQFCRL